MVKIKKIYMILVKIFFKTRRISIYGKKISEWSALAKWILNNNLTCDTNRWMI
jgi:hypothetical protein